MKICFSVSNLELGGAQMFVIRLSNELAGRGHQVLIYDHWPEHRQAAMVAMLAPNVRLASYQEGGAGRWLTWKINAALRHLRIVPDFRQTRNRKRFERWLYEQRPQILNSHSSFSDFVIGQCTLPPGCAYVPTLHGEYELMLESGVRQQVQKQIAMAIGKARVIIYTASKNLHAISEMSHPPARKINVGIDKHALQVKTVTRRSLGIPNDTIVLGMVARGIPSKGWEIAISAYKRLKENGASASLVLIGNGAYLTELVNKADDTGIHLLQFYGDALSYYSYYQLFDLFLFPSTFAGESVPNAVIEALSWNVPVLASRHAEISNMLLEGTPYACGLTVPVDDQLASNFAAALLDLCKRKDALRRLAEECPRAFAGFDLKIVCDQYLQTFTEATAAQS